MVEIVGKQQPPKEWKRTSLAIAGRTARRITAIAIGFGGPMLGHTWE